LLFLLIHYICFLTSDFHMRSIKLLIIFLSCVIVSSCIPQKNIVYLQDKGGSTNDTLQNNINEVPKPYRIQINDILNVRVKALDQETVSILNPAGEENLNATGAERAYFDGFTVDVHGNIRIPTLGKVNVLGYTCEDIEERIEKQLLEEQFKETANIFVTVKLAGLRYTATGEVGSTGSITLFQERVNVFEAIANAGDIPVTGNRKEVQIIRQYPQGQKIHTLDLTDLKVMQSPYYYIQPNDIIYVKPLKRKTWGVGTTGRESLQTIISVLGIITTTILLINR
jgi:polysaccharide export outer membrane protein